MIEAASLVEKKLRAITRQCRRVPCSGHHTSVNRLSYRLSADISVKQRLELGVVDYVPHFRIDLYSL